MILTSSPDRRRGEEIENGRKRKLPGERSFPASLTSLRLLRLPLQRWPRWATDRIRYIVPNAFDARQLDRCWLVSFDHTMDSLSVTRCRLVRYVAACTEEYPRVWTNCNCNSNEVVGSVFFVSSFSLLASFTSCHA